MRGEIPQRLCGEKLSINHTNWFVTRNEMNKKHPPYQDDAHEIICDWQEVSNTPEVDLSIYFIS